MKVLISVVICFYNAEKYIIPALDSLTKQTFRDFELILINDGSIDFSDILVKKYLNEFQNYKYIKQENKGLNESRNIGLHSSSSTTRYIIFLDADDTFNPLLLESLLFGFSLDNKIAAVFCDHIKFTGFQLLNNNYGEMYNLKFGIPFKTQKRNYLTYFDLYLGQHRLLEATTLIKKDILLKIGGWDVVNFPKGQTNGESISLILKLLKYGDIKFINKKLYNYRIHNSQITNNNIFKQEKINEIIKQDFILRCKNQNSELLMLYINNIKKIISYNQNFKFYIKTRFFSFLKDTFFIIQTFIKQLIIYFLYFRNIKINENCSNSE
jgi:glycosyltransferase involved in cell wall biosynthesis